MFENFDMGDGGNATADTPSTPDTSADVSVDAGADVPAIDTPSLDSGALQDAPADTSLTTQLETQETPQTEEDALAEALKAAEDPLAPKWFREQLQRTNGYVEKLKSEKTAAEQLAAQFQGKATFDPAEIERMRGAEERIFALRSISATPEQIEQTIAELNPRQFNAFRQQTVWNALANPDGTPNLDNLQAVVDRFSGEPGKVGAKDVLQAIDAFKNGSLSKDDLHNFATQEEYEAYQRTQAYEQSIKARETEIAETQRYQETQVRTGEISRAAENLQSQVYGRIQPLVERFKLTPQPNEPKIATDYKNRVNERIAQIVNQSTATIPAFGEVSKAFEILGKAGEKPIDAQSAVTEIQQFLSGAGYQTTVNKGLSELTAQIEKAVAEEASIFSLLMEGYAARQAKAGNARPVVGAPNQSAGLPKLTPEQLARMSAADRNKTVTQNTSALMNELMNGTDVSSRFGEQ